jgi:hypothetical protein
LQAGWNKLIYSGSEHACAVCLLLHGGARRMPFFTDWNAAKRVRQNRRALDSLHKIGCITTTTTFSLASLTKFILLQKRSYKTYIRLTAVCD